ncbi:hypothetical protein CRI94_08295 [Longibacter salinarum]|uniref:DUF1232 domain-containing protein n=1 Tax=Longibacter salinarum TaxID=1850348 RepID=A0A2A8CZG4_9BACT|nr:hypothetical protein CRI94_08295 [Longibacter salinarum]
MRASFKPDGPRDKNGSSTETARPSFGEPFFCPGDTLLGRVVRTTCAFSHEPLRLPRNSDDRCGVRCASSSLTSAEDAMPSESSRMRDRIAQFFRRGRSRVESRASSVRNRVAELDAADVRRRLEAMDTDTVREQLNRIDPGFLSKGADQMTDADIDRVIREADDVEASFDRSGALGRLLDDGRLLLNLVRDARTGRYRKLPRWSLSAAVFTLLYVLNPMDLIPDVIPGIGALDDAAVVSLCLIMMEQDLLAYRSWRRKMISNGNRPAEDTDVTTG